MSLAVSLATVLSSAAAGLSTNGTSKDGPIQVRWRPEAGAMVGSPGRTVVEVTGLTPESLAQLAQGRETLAAWQSVLRATTTTGNSSVDTALPPMSGTYEVAGRTLRFIPAFPLSAGVGYRAELRLSAVPGILSPPTSPIVAIHQVPAHSARSTTEVSALYPSVPVLPQNLLKFYLHFTAPMSRGQAYEHIHLLDAKGQVVELPFLEIDEELWDPSLTRLTLLLDPGRIKRGVRPLEEIGSPFHVGDGYQLVVDRTWQDAHGNPLRQGFTKTFTITTSDRETPDPTRWKITAPKAGSRTPLKLSFGEPMDHALTQRLLRVVDAHGRIASGEVTVLDHEQVWSWAPTVPWSPGEYWIQIPHLLEDLAGNNIGRPFDVDLTESPPPSSASTSTQTALPFTVK